MSDIDQLLSSVILDEGEEFEAHGINLAVRVLEVNQSSLFHQNLEYIPFEVN